MQKLKHFDNGSRQRFWSIHAGLLKEIAGSFSKEAAEKGVRTGRSSAYLRQGQELEGLLQRTGPS